MDHLRLHLVVLLGASFLVSGCHVLRYPKQWQPEGYPGTVVPETPSPRPPPAGDGPSAGPESPVSAALDYAVSHLGARPPLKARDRTFRFDCSGFVQAAYYQAGIDLFSVDAGRIQRGMSGTEIIYQYTLETGGAFTRNPAPGDLVFFDNTYDRNRNGKLDDTFTHLGIVEKVLPGGTLQIVHLGNAGIGRIQMTLSRPNVYRDADTGEILNHKLRRQRNVDPARTRYLAAQLFHAFGRPYVSRHGDVALPSRRGADRP